MPFSGTFQQIVDFLRRLERNESFVRVNGFTLQPNTRWGTDEGPLWLDLSVSTFRFDERAR